MIKNIKLKFLFFCCIFNSYVALAQSKVDSDVDRRIISSVSQLTGALSIQRGLSKDPNCSKIKYSALPLDIYIGQLVLLNNSKDKKSVSKSDIDELKKSIEAMINVEVPGKGIMWKMTYDSMLVNSKNTLKLSGEVLCNALNDSALNLFQKSIDNIKLIK